MEMNARPSSPEIVCLHCGDVGFSNAFVYCVKCLKCVVHRYCLNVLPKSTNEFVRWLCDDCEAKKKNQHHLLKKYCIRNKTRDCITSELIQDNSGTGIKKNGTEHPTLQSYDCRAKISLVECSESGDDRQMVGLGMKDETLVLSVADERKLCEPSTSQLHEGKVNDKECISIGFNEHAKLASDSTLSKDAKRIEASLKRDHNLDLELDPETAAALPPLSSDKGSLAISKKMKSDMPDAANLKDHKTLFAQHLKKQKGHALGTPSADMTTERRGSNLSRESDAVRDRSHVNSGSCNGFPKASTISPLVDCSMIAGPIMDSVWRGSFNIYDNEDYILEDVMAHMSNSACQKVHDEACQFKPVLDLEMLHRAHVWPQSFEKSEVVTGNIALYFFPSERSERFYDVLVSEMVDEDLALKAIVKNAELLLFTSTKLPLSYWRFQGKYYLWGVFREKQPMRSSSPSCRRESRYKPVMHKDRIDDSGSVAAMKKFGGHSPLSPLSHCSSYGSRIS